MNFLVNKLPGSAISSFSQKIVPIDGKFTSNGNFSAETHGNASRPGT